MVDGAICSAGAGVNAGTGGGSAGVGGNAGVGGLNICLVKTGVDVGCVVMGAVVVTGLLGCTCKESGPVIEV